MLALSRTCDLRDFPACRSPADWQQCLAAEAWARWVPRYGLAAEAPEGSLVVNYAGTPFEAPDPAARYQLRGQGRPETNGRLPAVFALGVLNHVVAPVTFLAEVERLLGDGGLLFLTMTYWAAEGPDTAAGHRERLRIYSVGSYARLVREARRHGFVPFGEIDWSYHGDVLSDHSLASLVLLRRALMRKGD